MKEWIFRDLDGEKFYLRMDGEDLRIVPKRGRGEENVVPVAEIERVCYELDTRGTNLRIYRGGKPIRLCCTAELKPDDLAALLPGLNVVEEKEKWTAKDWLGLVALVALFAVFVVLVFKGVMGERPARLLIYPVFVLVCAATSVRRWDWIFAVVFGLKTWDCCRGIMPVEPAKLVLSALLATAVMLGLMLLISRLKPRKALRRLLVLTLITALTYAPPAALTLQAMLPVESRESFEAVVTETDYLFAFGRVVKVEGYDGWLTSEDYLAAGDTVRCEAVTNKLGFEYIQIESDAED